jgi:hypothetical protein
MLSDPQFLNNPVQMRLWQAEKGGNYLLIS